VTHACALVADGATRTVFELGRIQSNADWILPLAALVVIGLYVRGLYRRDAAELSPPMGWLLTALRVLAFLGLLVLYLQPQWRTEREATRNSRAMVLIDTSSSMGLADAEAAGPTTLHRLGQVAAALEETDLLERLRRVHDVVVLRFDETVGRLVSFEKRAATETDDEPTQADGAVAWSKSLTPGGSETRLGDAIRQLVYEERNLPISGIVVFSDGGQNAGTSVDAAIEAAAEAKIPVFPVGVGSDRLPSNARVYRLEALPRAYPGDPYSVTALVQVQGGEGADSLPSRTARIELLMRDADDPAGQAGSGTVVDSEDVILAPGGEILPVKFELTPGEVGRRTICVRLVASRPDSNPNDDFREADVEVVDRKDRVLLFAGGPSREYRFLRGQLFRDASMTVDALLQTSASGISQEADAILDAFPATREEMFAYDCLVAIDPDWRRLSSEQLDVLEQWVAEQGGGMIAIAGNVYAGEAVTGWIQDPAMERICDLYPVEFQRRRSVLASGIQSGKQPWPLDFTREGLEAECVWLEDEAAANLRAWARFAGVYSYCPVRGAKAAAVVLARFSDPRARQGDQGPVYFAEQFYGSGRVFYLGSGEMWRLRQVEEGYFERFYTRLIRHVSQGRMRRESSRGALMVGQESYALGKTVEVRATLTNAQLAPLEAAEVTLEVFRPDGGVEAVALRVSANRSGTFTGQFTVLQEGTYRLELPVPESSNERLTRRVQVTLPDLERQDPRRNDPLLARLASGTGGVYYRSIAAAVGPGSADPLTERLRDRTKTVILTAATNPAWEEAWLRWLMIAVLSVLCLEWLFRRLSKLA